MITRLRQEDGFTLPELLTTLAIGMVVVLATLTLVETTMRRSGEISARIEAVQTGRTAMDTMTRQLRSTVCIQRGSGTGSVPSAFDAAGPDLLRVYTDLRDTSIKGATGVPSATSGPDKRELSYVADPAPKTTGTIVEKIWKTTGPASGIYQYPTTPTSTRPLLVNVERAKVGGVDVPVFQYFKYDFAAAAATGEPATPTYPLTGALDVTQMKSIAKVKITYKANPAIKRIDGSATTVFTNEVFTRNVDANADTDELSEPCK